MVKWYNQNCTMGIKGIQDNIHTFLWKKYLNTIMGLIIDLFRFPRLWNNLLDFKNSKFFLHNNIFKFSIWMNFWNFEDWEEIFIYWGDYLAILEKIFLEWMSTCYLIDTLGPHYYSFFNYNWHIGIIKGIVDVHHLQSSIY